MDVRVVVAAVHCGVVEVGAGESAVVGMGSLVVGGHELGIAQEEHELWRRAPGVVGILDVGADFGGGGAGLGRGTHPSVNALYVAPGGQVVRGSLKVRMRDDQKLGAGGAFRSRCGLRRSKLFVVEEQATVEVLEGRCPVAFVDERPLGSDETQSHSQARIAGQFAAGGVVLEGVEADHRAPAAAQGLCFVHCRYPTGIEEILGIKVLVNDEGRLFLQSRSVRLWLLGGVDQHIANGFGDGVQYLYLDLRALREGQEASEGGQFRLADLGGRAAVRQVQTTVYGVVLLDLASGEAGNADIQHQFVPGGFHHLHGWDVVRQPRRIAVGSQSSHQRAETARYLVHLKVKGECAGVADGQRARDHLFPVELLIERSGCDLDLRRVQDQHHVVGRCLLGGDGHALSVGKVVVGGDGHSVGAVYQPPGAVGTVGVGGAGDDASRVKEYLHEGILQRASGPVTGHYPEQFSHVGLRRHRHRHWHDHGVLVRVVVVDDEVSSIGSRSQSRGVKDHVHWQ